MTTKDTSLNGAMARLRELARDGNAAMSIEAHLAEAERQLRLAGDATAPGAPFLPIQTRVGIAQQHLTWAQLRRERRACIAACHEEASDALEAGSVERPRDVIEGSGVAAQLGLTARVDGPWWTILEATVGSQAYGLATEGSDVDTLAVALAPTSAQLGLRPITAGHGGTRVGTAPDRTVHEAGKACQLLLACNPSVTELLWLPDDSYRTCAAMGESLVLLRSAFLSRDRVHAAYLGYATGQVRRLATRNRSLESEEQWRRVGKHARHVWRLLHQGYQLYVTGELTVRLSAEDATLCREFGERVAAGDVQLARDELHAYDAGFRAATSVLPEKANHVAVETWLRRARRHALWLEDEGRWPGTESHA